MAGPAVRWRRHTTERLSLGHQLAGIGAPADRVHSRDYVFVSTCRSGLVFKQEGSLIDLRTIVHATDLLAVPQYLILRDGLVARVGGLPA